jgi:hypothetical protein
MCLSKTASVSACVLEVGVGKPSVGQGRGQGRVLIVVDRER